MVIYADILFFNNTLMTFAILWSVGQLLEIKVSIWRLFLGALIGTLYSFIIFYFKFHNLPYILNIIIHIGLNFGTAIVMIYSTFGKISIKKYIKAVGYLYLVSFTVIGTILSVFYIYGIQPFQVKKIFLLIFGVVILFIIGKIGWDIFQKYITPDVLYVSLNIVIEKKEITLVGLIDTGNQLSEPVTGFPVVIVEINPLESVFNKEIMKRLNEKAEIIELIRVFSKYEWENKIRVLPFSNIGQEDGLLLGIKPDKIIFDYKEEKIETGKVILGLTSQKLDENEKYQALIHPGLLKQDC
ncbi:MAG: sigma-E processing peptidase SpoIIGA [Bacillota bacterium]